MIGDEDCLDSGSGSTGVACAAEGMRFLGIERERAYYDIAYRRIELAYTDEPA